MQAVARTPPGRLVWPTSIIPGAAEALFQLRDADPAVLDRLNSELHCLARITNQRGRCKLSVERLSASTPAMMDEARLIGGICHHWSENTSDADIVLGAQVFTDAILDVIQTTEGEAAGPGGI